MVDWSLSDLQTHDHNIQHEDQQMVKLQAKLLWSTGRSNYSARWPTDLRGHSYHDLQASWGIQITTYRSPELFNLLIYRSLGLFLLRSTDRFLFRLWWSSVRSKSQAYAQLWLTRELTPGFSSYLWWHQHRSWSDVTWISFIFTLTAYMTTIQFGDYGRLILKTSELYPLISASRSSAPPSLSYTPQILIKRGYIN